MSVEPQELAAVVANVDRTAADVAAAALASYGISSRVVVDPTAGNAKAPASASSPAHGVLVRREELALAVDILQRSADAGLPAEFSDDEVEAWSSQLARDRRHRPSRTTITSAVYALLFLMVIALAAGAIAALVH